MLHSKAVTIAVALYLITTGFPAHSQSYPARPVRLIAPFAPGGGVDIVTRLVGQKLGEALGQQFVIDNRPGAGSNLGTGLAAAAQPDGHTLVVVSVAYAINRSLYKSLGYDPKDLTVIGLIASAPNLLVVHPSLPVSSPGALVDLAKRTPGSLNYASAGAGTPTHLAAELFNSMSGAALVHIPYRGGGPAIIDLISGQVKVMFPGIIAAIAHVNNGRLKPLGVTSLKPSRVAPGVPTIAASGFPGFEAENWYALLAPAKTSRAIVNMLNVELNKITSAPEVQERLARGGAEPLSGTPTEARMYVLHEMKKWAKVVAASGATVK
ncbi:MAG: hypothetical protein A3G24_23015 [Betaproteobacteria bacterium RIFCSPLOWO2_12_FULL_62_13]|nr:MAG: hypothetical protein A3G24_23015 [Betaproteobacteria bacterium RIFCSPLOWO2_12_FULL_62_13]